MRAIRKYFQKYWKYKIQQTKEELNTMKIGNDIYYVGVNDHQVDLFEGQYVVPNGMSYNSYVIKDEKIAVMDTVDAGFTEEWLGKVAEVLDGAKPDYLVVQHMEPDHAANIENFMKAYPDTTVVANTKTFTMMENFFRGMDLEGKKHIVANGDTLTLGKHVLTFVFAPMVHWPEVMVTYDSTDKVLFSADGFGKFGALDVEEDWDCEARRYYIGIVGKYGPQVQKLLKAAATLDIQTICPLHGPILTENLGHYLEKYDIWSSDRLHICIRTYKESSRASCTEAGGKGLPEGCCLRSCKRRHGRGSGGCFPLRQAGTGQHYIQRRSIPVYAYIHREPDRA